MNRTLRRPMFRIGGSVAEGITSGLDQPQPTASRVGFSSGGNETIGQEQCFQYYILVLKQ